ncbi:MAG: VWA domain-containing protein [Rhodobacteraceae bacterium]|nr:VWA domain-containing protein [Paracoccaceae bacterium]
MSAPPAPPVPAAGSLARNILLFARALRKAGLPVGPGQTVEAVRAVAAAGFTRREDFYWTLHAVLVRHARDRAVFAQVFRLFWRDPAFLEHMMSMLLPAVHGTQDDRRAVAGEKRAAEALLDGVERPPPVLPEGAAEEAAIEIDARATASAEERLRQLDFEQMSAAELAAARRMVARLVLPVPPLAARRTAPAPRGRAPDWRATFRQGMRKGGELPALSWKMRRQRWPALVALCDISGSMATYSRMMLHFLHAVANTPGEGWSRVHAFTFGTRLTNVTRQLQARDADEALALCGAEAQDWEGGTRIADCLRAFNRDWARRVTGQGAVVLLITDGLDRSPAGGADLSREARRLRLSARRLIWVNPLLRWDGFAPRARGIRAILPHADAMVAGHSLASLEALGAALTAAGGLGRRPPATKV